MERAEGFLMSKNYFGYYCWHTVKMNNHGGALIRTVPISRRVLWRECIVTEKGFEVASNIDSASISPS